MRRHAKPTAMFAPRYLDARDQNTTTPVALFLFQTRPIFGDKKGVPYPKMVALEWKIPLKWMIWGCPYFRKPPLVGWSFEEKKLQMD